MLDIINEKLDEIEAREGVRILHCVESGSRAWGFASPDSDYDVRFIYARPTEYYLRLDKTRDVIEWQLDDTLDINGWDIKKALQLLHKSNPTLFEWNSSPIVYRTTPEWERISNVINSYFVAKQGIYHYLNTARHNYKEFLTGQTVKYKKYFYVLRPILACKWIIDRGTPPPMLFSELMDGYLDEDMTPDLKHLLDLKMNAPEISAGAPFTRVNDYLIRTIQEVDAIIAEMPEGQGSGWQGLNELFITALNITKS